MAVRISHSAWMAIALLTIVVPWFFVARTIDRARPVKVSTQPRALVWGGLVFSSQEPLGHWLRSRGASYGHWLASHPAGAAVLEHRPLPTPAAPPKPETPAATAAKSSRSGSESSKGGIDSRHLLVEIAGVLLAVLTTALVVFAIAPRRVLAWVRPEWESLGGDTRIVAFAVALSVAVGALVTQLAG